MSSFRQLRVRELLKRELGEVIRREFPTEQLGVMTVNDVVITSDLHLATAHIGFVGSEEQQKRGFGLLQRERKRIQGLIARSVVLKYTPQLRFVRDESVTRGNRVLEIIDEIERSTPQPEGDSEDPRADHRDDPAQ